MRVLQVTVLLVLVLCMTHGVHADDALVCNCVFQVGGRGYETIETCQSDGNVCVSVTGQIPHVFGSRPVYYRGCMKSTTATKLQDIVWLNVHICNTGLCN
ncbi:unnamed protein product [Knipowitschia caucasica]|uniref:UPAR/Ly6 domain-containing protein n=1 Tax=Knipowitschia caucasica TaxID=637954 RepID=A0AAV2LDQ2_KNICA